VSGRTYNESFRADRPFYGSLKIRIMLPCGHQLKYTVMADVQQEGDIKDFVQIGGHMLNEWYKLKRPLHDCASEPPPKGVTDAARSPRKRK
jgi:hypothetical protein